MYFEDKIPATLHVTAPLTLTVSGVSYTFGIDVFTGDSGLGGTSGAVPAPAGGDAADGKFLSADGTWAVPSGGGAANPGGTYGQVQFNDSGVLGGFAVGGDGTLNTATGILLVTKTNGVAFGSLATQSSVSLSTQATGTLQAAQFPALTGDVTTPGASLTTTIATGAVTLAKMADLAANSILGNNTGSPATPIALTATQATAMLNAVVGDSGSGGTKGLVPAPASGDAAAAKYLAADGTWSVPSGTGSALVGGSAGQIQYNNSGAFGGFTMSGDATIVTSTGVLTIANGAVSLAKMANLAANSILGNNTGSPATPIELTATQATAMLNAMVGDSGSGGTKGLVPAATAGDAASGKFLKADGTFAVPLGSTVTTASGRFFNPPPAVADFTWYNQGTSTAVQIGGVGTPISFDAQRNTSPYSVRILAITPPAAPYSVIAYLRSNGTSPTIGTMTTGIGFFDTATTDFFGLEHVTGTSGPYIRAQKYTDYSVASTTPFQTGANTAPNIHWTGHWIRLRNDGSTLYFEGSGDGWNFRTLYSESVGTFITPDRVYWSSANITASTEHHVSLLSWKIVNDANS